MTTIIPESQFMDVLRSAEHTLFRLELQTAYEVGESADVAAFVAGKPAVPDSAGPWFEQVRAWRAVGIQVERVRVQEDPPTNYQRWERWVGAWNIEAGEVMRYMTRKEAHSAGLLPAAGNVDWWLIDSSRILTLHFADDHTKICSELVDDPKKVVQACAWRDLAVHHSHPESFRAIATQGIQ